MNLESHMISRFWRLVQALCVCVCGGGGGGGGGGVEAIEYHLVLFYILITFRVPEVMSGRPGNPAPLFLGQLNLSS